MFSTQIILPAYNEKIRLDKFLRDIVESAKACTFSATIIVADDGSERSQSEEMLGSVERAKSFGLGSVHFEYVKFPKNRGKGAVLKDLFERAVTDKNVEIVGFADSDGATAFDDIIVLIETLRKDHKIDAVVGCRLKCLGKNVHRSLKRHLSGRIFATLLSNLFNIPIYDSQCGAKFFRTTPLREKKLLEYCYDKKWLFDTQLTLVAWKSGLEIVEKPVNWVDQADSKVSLFSDAFRMFVGLVKYKRYLNKIRKSWVRPS